MKKNLAIKNWQSQERPREKLIHHGTQTLTNAELLAIIIGTGSNEKSAVDLAREVLARAQNQWSNLARLSIGDLCKIPGIGPAKAVSIKSTLEIGGRRQREIPQTQETISSSKSAYELMKPLLEDKPYEEFWVVLVNRANRFINRVQISEGGVSGTVADPKRIFKLALEFSASGLLLYHNHPSGNLKPSDADKRLTLKIKEGCKQLDMSLLDHIIIANTGYYSFADDGLI